MKVAGLCKVGVALFAAVAALQAGCGPEKGGFGFGHAEEYYFASAGPAVINSPAALGDEQRAAFTAILSDAEIHLGLLSWKGGGKGEMLELARVHECEMHFLGQRSPHYVSAFQHGSSRETNGLVIAQVSDNNLPRDGSGFSSFSADARLNTAVAQQLVLDLKRLPFEGQELSSPQELACAWTLEARLDGVDYTVVATQPLGCIRRDATPQ